MIVLKTFRYRLEPSRGQRQLFARFAGCCRFVFNHALVSRKLAYEQDGKTLSFFDQCKALTKMKKAEETAWLAEVHSQVLQQALKDLDAAYRNFFRRVKRGETPGFPRFKKKGVKDSFRYPQGIKVQSGRVYLPKIGWVRYHDSRPIEGKILLATIKRDGDHWFVGLSCEVDLPELNKAPFNEDRAVGIDLGLKSFAYLSDGTEVLNPRFLEGAQKRLRRAQRSLSRRVKGSANWFKQKAEVARLHRKVRDARLEFLHQLSTRLVKNHDVIAVEDLNIRGMVKNRHLARAISDAGWGLFLAMLKYKAEWMGKDFVQIERFLATSKTCSRCGEQQPMPLSTRTYACDTCRLVIDRDFNASLNIRAAGLSALHACGGGA